MEALKAKVPARRTARLSSEQKAELEQWVISASNFTEDDRFL